MSNIEEDIKRCEKLIEPQNANWIGITNQLAIAHLIEKVKELRAMCEEYCPKTERIKELEEENRIFKDSNVLVNRYFKLKDNSIPVQKVKDKIEKLKTDLRFIACNKDCSKCFNKEGKALYRESDFIFCYAYHQIKILQELLEDK